MHEALRLGAVCALAGALAGCGDPPATPKPATLVVTQVVTREPRQASVTLTGDVQARFKAELSFRVSGRVTERLVDVGAQVKAGDILAKIDPTEQLADIEASKAAVAAAESQLKVATNNFERQQGLLDKGFTTRPAYDQAQQALSTAQGTLESAKAQLGTARDALTYTELRASADGIITARSIEVGQIAQAAQTAFWLAQDGDRDAVFDVYESIFFQQYESDNVSLNLVSDPSVTATGHVREVSPTIDPKTATVRVKVSIDAPPPAMSLGSAVQGTARWKPVERVILPWSALTAIGPSPAVFVVDPATNAVALKRIAVDTYQTDTIVVKDGLEPGERVVVDGAKMIAPGQIVTYNAEAKR